MISHKWPYCLQRAFCGTIIIWLYRLKRLMKGPCIGFVRILMQGFTTSNKVIVQLDSLLSTIWLFMFSLLVKQNMYFKQKGNSIKKPGFLNAWLLLYSTLNLSLTYKSRFVAAQSSMIDNRNRKARRSIWPFCLQSASESRRNSIDIHEVSFAAQHSLPVVEPAEKDCLYHHQILWSEMPHRFHQPTNQKYHSV